MLLQTNAYTVPREKADQHARLMKRFQDTWRRLGVSMEAYAQVGPEYSPAEEWSGRFVQILRFRDRRHLAQVQAAERADPAAQQLISELIAMVDLHGQIASGQHVPGYYVSITDPGQDVASPSA